MKTLIVYATKYGCTQECVSIMKESLQGEVKISTAEKCRYDLMHFDTIIIGGSVYMGTMRKDVTKFCKRNEKILLRKKIGLFACCYTPKGTEGFLETLFPHNLLTHAAYTTIVGGRMDYEKMSFAYRKLFQSLNKIEGFREGFVEPKIDVEEIQKLAERVKDRDNAAET